MQLKFTVWFTVYCWKTKNIAKNQIFAKIASLGIINNVSPSSHKNQRILEKLSLKTFFGPKLGLHCPPWVKVSLTNSHIAYNWTIHLYFLDVRFQLLCVCRSRFQPEETTRFFQLRTHSGPFLFFEGNNSSKKRLIELKV